MDKDNKYIRSQAIVATAQTLALAQNVLGFDVMELWSGDSGSCTYVHAADHILDAYPDLRTGLYPETAVHRLSPRLLDLAKSSTNGYYWHTVEDGETRIACFGTTAQTEMAFMLKGEDGQFDIFLVGFAIEKITFKESKVKFLSGLGYAIYVAVFDLDDDEGDIDPRLDIKADMARERLRYISKTNDGVDSDSRKKGSNGDLSELLFSLDVGPSEFYIPIEKLPVLMQPSNNLDIAHFNDIAYMSDGSNSNIYTAFLNGVRVVIKMLKKEVAQDQVALLEYDAEAALLSRVSHPNIIKLLGKGTAPRRFLVLEYLAGGSLSSKQNIVHSSHGSTKPILRKPTYTYEELLLLIRDIATALNHLHTRHAATGAVIIHRDIKPDNIGFTEKGEVKLFDFGLSTVVRKTRTTQEAYEMTGNTGSLRYMAPEVVLNRAYNEKVDVYSFGIMVWQIATDRIPFKGMSKDQFVRDIVLNKQRPKLDPSWPPGFKALLEGCWHDDYQKRPSSSFILDDINILLRNLKAQKPSVKIQSMFGDFII